MISGTNAVLISAETLLDARKARITADFVCEFRSETGTITRFITNVERDVEAGAGVGRVGVEVD